MAAFVLQHSREVTILCSAKVTQHHARGVRFYGGARPFATGQITAEPAARQLLVG